MNPLATSIFFHAIGAASAALCYTPMKKARGWSWQTFWLVQAAFCWLTLPILGAFLTIPNYLEVLREAPVEAMRNSFFLGMAYGIGGTAFGIAIKYVGYSVTYAMAIGISTVGGTAYAIAKGEAGLAHAAGNFAAFWAKSGAGWVVSGIVVGLVGVAFCGISGRMKERDQAAPGTVVGLGNLLLGIFLCVVAGLLSAVYNMALTEGGPIAAIAKAKAAGVTLLGIDAATFSNNAIYPFSNTGAFITTAIYCLLLHRRHGTARELIVPAAPAPGEPQPRISINWLLALATGALWYGQFFFYGFGHFYIQKVEGFAQTCWAIHMILLVLLGTLVGVMFKEWKGVAARTRNMLILAIALLISGKLILDYGNYLGSQKTDTSAPAAQATPSPNPTEQKP